VYGCPKAVPPLDTRRTAPTAASVERPCVANTGKAGASHRAACFAGKPAPTGLCKASIQRCTCRRGLVPRTPAKPVPATASPASRASPLPQDCAKPQSRAAPVGAASCREHWQSRCQPPRRLLRGQVGAPNRRSHRVRGTLAISVLCATALPGRAGLLLQERAISAESVRHFRICNQILQRGAASDLSYARLRSITVAGLLPRE
jgi:hypothetical protein